MKVVDHDRIKKCPTCDSAALVRDRLAQGFITPELLNDWVSASIQIAQDMEAVIDMLIAAGVQSNQPVNDGITQLDAVMTQVMQKLPFKETTEIGKLSLVVDNTPGSPIIDPTVKRKQILNPGSDEAVVNGCRCPRMDNGYGRGRGDGQFVMNEDCPMHGSPAPLIG